MKKLAIVILVSLPLLLGGCGLIGISTDIPLFNGSGATLEVINASSYPVTITVNGIQQKFEFPSAVPSSLLQPGQSAVIKRANWNVQPREVTIVAKAWAGDGKLVGILKHKLYIYSQQNQSDAWPLCDYDFHYSRTYGCGW